MEEDQHLAANSNEDEDSFFAGDAKPEEEEPQPQQHLTAKHKSPKQKKKHITKKKEKVSKPPKKQHNNKEKEKENRLYLMADRKAEEIIEKMKNFYELDLELTEKKKLACQKLSYIDKLSQELKNLYICEKFIEKDGLAMFERWLDKITINEQSFEPSVSLRKGVLQILLSLSVNPENVSRTNEIQRLVARQKRSQVKELRDLSEKIILKWNKIAYEAE